MSEQVPPGGWKYFEERTNITLMAYSKEKLINHLKSHRKSNGLPDGEPEKEIDEQLKKKIPDIKV